MLFLVAPSSLTLPSVACDDASNTTKNVGSTVSRTRPQTGAEFDQRTHCYAATDAYAAAVGARIETSLRAVVGLAAQRSRPRPT